jgi:predicted AlkP superfamily pyrophosphatase or phosphodiesterase
LNCQRAQALGEILPQIPAARYAAVPRKLGLLSTIRNSHVYRSLCAVLFASVGFVLNAVAEEAPRPTLLVTIVVDQFSADLFTEYRPMYAHGLARLAGGAVYPRGFQSHAATETCPGHSTILTGARPAKTGIIANDWQEPSRPRVVGNATTYGVYCAEQPGAANSKVTGTVISPAHLRVPTLGDRLKQSNANSRVVSIAGKDRSAVMLGGFNADLTLWWTPEGFVTYAGRSASVPGSIATTINQKIRSSIAAGIKPKAPKECASRAHDIAVSANVTIGKSQAIAPGSWRRWRASAALDAFTVDAAIEAMRQLELGKRGVVDLLAVSLAANDYVGHYFGTEGEEMCAQQISLDRTIGHLLDELDKTHVSYVVALTADHGGVDVTERNRQRGVVQAQRLDEKLLPSRMSAALAAMLGIPGPVILGANEFASDVWLSADIPASRRAEVLDAAARIYRSHPQVEIVFTKNELIGATPPTGPADEWTLLERAKASFDPQRSGDLIVLLKPYVSIYQKPKDVERDYVATHGSPWAYDRRVPILFWWRGIGPFEQPKAVETVDIVPTFAGLIGLRLPDHEIDGQPLPMPALIPGAGQ